MVSRARLVCDLSARALRGAACLLLMQGMAHAQDAARTVQRPSQLLGMPGLSIDLNARATSRHAIVIGNGDYQTVRDLPNAVADARLVAGVLKRSGYAVTEYYDLDKRGFESALRRMIIDTSKGAELVIYYAGHGVQIGANNRLIPVDARIETALDLPFETVSLSSVLSMGGSRSRSLVVILDSCRDNPFPDRSGIIGLDSIPQDLRTGFTAQDSPVNSLIVFSTSPGAVAFDGKGDHSPFAEALNEVAIANPDAAISDMLKDVRRRVFVATGGLQVPWESSSLIETVTLDGQPAVAGFQLAEAGVLPADTQTGPAVTLDLALDRQVPLGPAFGRGGAEALMLALPPSLGRIEVADGPLSRGLVLMVAEAVVPGGLTYANRRPETAALSLAAPKVTDRFELVSGGKRQAVELSLTVEPCDFQAGDHLDPDGVGIARYPNEIEVTAALAACQAAVAARPDVGRFQYQLGRVQLALRDYAAAEASFLRARDLGHTRAWHALGMLAITQAQQAGGAVRGKAPEAALALLAEGADRGDPYAFHSLGLQMLEQSDEQYVQRQGFDLLSRAMEVGHTFSMNALGTYFLDRDSDHYDYPRGRRYYVESAARGDIYGYHNLGWLLLDGGEEPSDPATALELFRKASDGGHPAAPTSIGRMWFKGQMPGSGPNAAKAVEWYDIGLVRGDAWGGANAAWVIANRRPAGYGAGDAAMRAAKAATLRDAVAGAEANALLATLPRAEIDAGAQRLMAALGQPVTADGAFGPGSQAALDTLAAQFSTPFPDDPQARLKTLAAVYWTTQTFRVDLF